MTFVRQYYITSRPNRPSTFGTRRERADCPGQGITDLTDSKPQPKLESWDF